MADTDLNRFLDAQERDYPRALAEIRNGRKQSHWMWYVFPQIAGLGLSPTAVFYAIRDKQEAIDYRNHPVLGTRLIDIANAMLAIDGKTANQVLGSPDDVKLRSCMSLFGALPQADPVFQQVLDKFYNSSPDPETLDILKSDG